MTKSSALIIVALITGCARTPHNTLDPDRLLRMANDEAGQITSPKERLTRQLNIANHQTQTGHPAQARDTLAQAHQTLEHADKSALNDHQRLAGWISLCELARQAQDKPFANSALDQALAALNDLNPHQSRCPYVLGIEREVKLLRGQPEAIKLLTTAADWAVEIPDQPTRRAAYLAFAEELFRCNDYQAARTLLRKDQDAAWRSDSLIALSDRARYETPAQDGWLGRKSLAYAAAEAPAAATSDKTQPQSFNKPLDFKSNFYRP